MRPMKFAIFGNTYQAKKSTHVERLLSILDRHRAEVYICREFYQFLTDDLKLQIRQAGVFEGNDFEADMVLSIGGDGTFLKAASRVGSRNIPILGINTGRLGFLADVSPEEMEDTFNDIYSNNYRIEDRSVLQVSCKEQELKGYPFGLNEIAVLKRDSSSMISIHTAINGAYLTTYQADGLVIAEGDAGDGRDLVAFQKLVAQIQGGESQPACVHKEVESALRLHNTDIRDGAEAGVNVLAAHVIFVAHVADEALVSRKGLNASILGERADVGSGVVLNHLDGLGNGSRGCGIAQAPSGHGVTLGKAVDGDGQVVQFRTEGGDADVLGVPVYEVFVNFIS